MKMKWLISILFISLLAGTAFAQEKMELKTEKEKRSYAVGANMAKNIKQQQLDLNTDVLIKAVQDVFSGQNLAMTDDEIRKTIVTLQAELKRKRLEAMKQKRNNVKTSQ